MGRSSVASTRSIARPRFRRRSAGGSVARTRKPPIDINAWQAGIAQRPEDYEWCSFAAAVKGSEKARLRVHVRQRGRLGRDPRQP